jgi:hypothetical protein
MNILPNNDVQYSKKTSFKMNIAKSIGSILVRAYSQQEKNKLIHP